jgi:hypothetical protein
MLWLLNISHILSLQSLLQELAHAEHCCSAVAVVVVHFLCLDSDERHGTHLGEPAACRACCAV